MFVCVWYPCWSARHLLRVVCMLSACCCVLSVLLRVMACCLRVAACCSHARSTKRALINMNFTAECDGGDGGSRHNASIMAADPFHKMALIWNQEIIILKLERREN